MSGSSDPMPLAVVGMSCRFPGAENLEAYWDMLVRGRCAVGELPAHLFDQSLYYSSQRRQRGRSYSKLAALVGRTSFNPQHYPNLHSLNLPTESQHLVIVDVASEALRHAGYDPLNLPQRQAGVFIGNTQGSEVAVQQSLHHHAPDVLSLVRHLPQAGTTDWTPLLDAAVNRFRSTLPFGEYPSPADLGMHWPAAMLSRALGLNGPSVVLNAACASSLQAMTLASQVLQSGEIDWAIVGGTNYLRLDRFLRLSFAQALSASGTCPFDADADGLILAEGHAAVILKPLDRAQHDGDRILAVVTACGMSADGRGKSVWAPRAEGQSAAMQRAYAQGVDASRLGYVEAHATSTQIGDATEMGALAGILQEVLPHDARIPVGSVKANMGHALESAGLAGFIKTVLILQRGVIPRQINVQQPNPKIDWDHAPFYIPTENLPWPERTDGRPRLAAVNAFGIGGLNAHVVLEDAPRTTPTPRKHTPPATEPLAVVGMGAVYPGAFTLSALRELLASHRDPKHSLPPTPSPEMRSVVSAAAQLGGFLDDYQYDWKRHKIPPLHMARANPLQFLLLDAVDQALHHSGYDTKTFDKTRTAVVVGTMSGGDFYDQLQLSIRVPEMSRALRQTLAEAQIPASVAEPLLAAFEEEAVKRLPAILDETSSSGTSTIVTLITKTFDFMGGGFALDAGLSSSLAALWGAWHLLQSNACDLVLCAAGQRWMNQPTFKWFAAQPTLAGQTPGEGGGALLLKRLSAAQRDGDRIYGIVRGVGAGFAPSPADASQLVWKRCLDATKLSASDVSLLQIADGPPLKVHSANTQLGHTLGGSGMTALLDTLLKFENQTTPVAHPEGRLLAGVQNVDVQGMAFQALLESPHLHPASVSAPASGVSLKPTSDDCRIVRLAASSWEELANQAESKNAETWWADSADSSFSHHDTFRLAMVCHDAGELRQNAQLAARCLRDRPGPLALYHKHIYAQVRPAVRPLVACLFPGPASRYEGMMLPLVEQFPPAAAFVRSLNNKLQPLGLATFEQSLGGHAKQNGQSTPASRLGLFWASAVSYESLLALGIKPQRVAGYGLGAYSALAAAGAWNWETAAEAVDVSLRLAAQSSTVQSAVLITSASVEMVEACCQPASGPRQAFVIALHAADQTVCGGERQAVHQLAGQLQTAGFVAQVTDNYFPAHTPLLSSLPATLTPALETFALCPPPVAFLSTQTNRYLADPADLRDDLLAQWIQPIRYQTTIERLARDGVKMFIEVGPNQLLTTLHRRLVPSTSLCLSTDIPRRPSLTQLHSIRAALDTFGVFDSWHESPFVMFTSTVDNSPCRRSAPRLSTAPSSPATVARRFVLRMQDAPGKTVPGQLSGTYVLYGQSSDTAAIAAWITARQGKVLTLPAGADSSACLAALEAASQKETPVGMILLSAREPAAGKLASLADWNTRKQAGLITPFLLVQSWLNQVRKQPPSDTPVLIGVTGLGGNLGFTGPVTSPEGGGIAGFLKAVHAECQHPPECALRVKVLDFSPSEPPQFVAEQVGQELFTFDGEVEVGWSQGRRQVPRLLQQPVSTLPPGPSPNGGVWLVTGGARGITAVVARELARRFGWRLHVLGRTAPQPIPAEWKNLNAEQEQALKRQIAKQAMEVKQSPAQAWAKVQSTLELDRNLQAYAQAGVSATYHVCDVADAKQLEAVLAAIRQQGQAITGILHGAGVRVEEKFSKKQPQTVLNSVATKVDSALALALLTQQEPLQFFVGFASMSGRFGANGRTDYAMSNEALCKMLAWLQTKRPEVRTLGVHWQAWGDVGMFAQQQIAVQQNQLSLMPVQEGVEHLADELLAGCPEREVLIYDGTFQERYYTHTWLASLETTVAVSTK